MKAFFFRILIPLVIPLTFCGQSPEIKNLVFEGAGVRGIAYAGVLEAIENEGITEDIEKVGGTSAGAFAAMLFALGYTSDEIGSIISGTKFQKLNDGQFSFVGGMIRTKNRFGWYRGEKLSQWIGTLIEEKTGDEDFTFEEFREKGYRDIYITATCLNRQELLVLSNENYPDMKVRDAVRISMSIPLYYAAVFVDEQGTTYKKPIDGMSLDVMVDGGIIGNFPIQIFDEKVPDSTGMEKRIPNYHTLGFRLDTDEQIKCDSESSGLAPCVIEDFRDYTTAFYTMVIENLNRQDLTEDDWNRTVSVSSVGISPRVKKLSNKQKTDLIRSGRESTEKYFLNKNKMSEY